MNAEGEAGASVATGSTLRVTLIGILLGAFPGSGPTALSGQEGPFSFQIRGGASLPVLSFRDESGGWEGRASQGGSFAMGFNVPVPGPTGGYLGFSQHRFRCDSSICPEGENWVSTGFDMALRVVLGSRRIRPWIQGGLHTHKVQARIREGTEVVSRTSGSGFGFEAGGGLLVQIGTRVSLSPGVRFGTARVPFSGYPSLRIQYLIADLGLVLGF